MILTLRICYTGTWHVTNLILIIIITICNIMMKSVKICYAARIFI